MLLKILILFSLLFVLSAKDLEFYTENSGYNNYMSADGQIKGHNYEIVKEMMSRRSLDYPVKLTTWSRSYGLIQSKPNIALFSMTRTKAREEMFKWVGPLSQTRFVLYGLKQGKFKVDSVEAAKKVRAVGCYKDDVRETVLLKEGFENLSSLTGVDANSRNLQKLLAGRIDLWITSDQVMYKEVKKAGLDLSLLEEKVVVRKFHVYLAFSKAVSDTEVAKWQAALDSMKKDGTYKKIMLKYPTGDLTLTFDKARAAE